MEVYNNEQEQVEALKAWWKKNGKFAIAIIILTIIASFAIRYWQQHKTVQASQASVLYEKLLITLSLGDKEAFENTTQLLQKNYGRTPYADLASLFAAKQAADAGKLDVAEQKLQALVKTAHSKYVQQIAQLRLARVLLAQNQAQKALEVLDTVNDPAYMSAINQLRGDIYLALNQIERARDAYRLAIAEMPSTEPVRALVQMKLDQLTI